MAVSLKHHSYSPCHYYLIHLLSIVLILPVQTTCQCYTDADIALYQQHTPSWLFQDTCNQCLANFTLYNENDIDDIPRKGLTCSKKDSTAVDGMWFYNGAVLNCETGNFNNFSFCERSQPGSITLYTKFSGESGGWPEGLYTCCIEGSCISTRVYLQDNTTKYYITDKTAIVESCTIDPPDNISQVPNEYTLRMVTSGIPPALLSAAINCTHKYGGTECGRSHYTLLDLEHERFQYSVPVTWNGNSDFTEHYYSCTANYGFNRDNRVEVSYSQLVEIRAPRLAPTSASYMILNSTSVIVNWEINEAQPAMNGFVINLTSEEDSSHTVVIRNPSARSYTVNDLVIDREYQISIRGFLDLIGSAITITVRLEVPQLLFLPIQSKTSSFTALWSVQDQPNSIHTSTSFTLVYTSLCNYTSRTLQVTDVYNVTVDKLSPGTLYSVTITPSNSVGIGDNKTIDIPLLNNGPPTAAPMLRSLQVVNASTVRVSWDQIDCDSRNGAIIGYKIMYTSRMLTTPTNVVDLNWENEETRYDVTGLEEGTEYQFQIAAVNDAGVGPHASLAVYTINTTITNLRSQESITIIELSWRPESGQPSNISLQYEVVYAIMNTSRNTTSNGGLLETYISYCNTTNSSVLVTGLQSNTWYAFGVRIIESASVTVDEFTSIVLKTKSESIDLLSTMLFNTSTVSLTWSPLPDTSIDEYLYDVGYSTCPNDQTRECTWSANDHSIDVFNKTYTMYMSTEVVGEKEVVSIPELTPGSCYLFGVRIRSLKGDRHVGGWNIVRNFTIASAQVSSSTDDDDRSLVIIIAVSVTAGILLVLVLCLTGTTTCLIRSNKLLKEELAIVSLKYNSYSTLDSLLERDDNQSKKRSHRQYRKNTINGNLTTHELQHSLITNKAPAPVSEYANDDDMSPFYNECASNDDIYDRITDVRPNKTPTYLEIHN